MTAKVGLALFGASLNGRLKVVQVVCMELVQGLTELKVAQLRLLVL